MRRFVSVVVVLAATLASGPSDAQAKLTVGDAPPAVKVAKWIRGNPVTTFEPGRTYVIEFWATWCGPCRQTIPHLTELARKYAGKVTFAGVSVWETRPGDKDTGYLDKVAKFVKDMGDKMDYSVAVDGPDHEMATAWMEAAGQDGIPAAFVIGPDGKIAWIGHPMEMGPVLTPVCEGKWDVATARKKMTETQEQVAKSRAAQEKLGGLYREGKYREFVAEVGRLEAAKEMPARQAAMMRFTGLVAVSEPEAYAYARSLAKGVYADDAQMLNALAWTIAGDRSPLKKPDYATAVVLAERAVTLTKRRDPAILDTLAAAHFKAGHAAKAAKVQRDAVALLAARSDVPATVGKQMREKLARYRKAAAK